MLTGTAMIRKATINDVKHIYELLAEYGRKGELLSRPLSELYDHLRDFSIYVEKDGSQIIGCCALQICWEDLAEIRSLAVHSEHVNKKIGSKLVEAALSEAKKLNIKRVFVLTYQTEFFKQYGFVEVDRSELPLKIWADCLICVKFPDCDETAMMKEIAPQTPDNL